MRVVVAPDSFGGTLTSRQAADAIVRGWSSARPGDDIVVVPLADGGEGTLDTLTRTRDELREVEVADPLGRPRTARWLLRDGVAIVESAEACGLAHLEPAERNPLRATTYGVGQILEDVRQAGVRDVCVGLGGSATVDGGAGALAALGYDLRTETGSGLKIGGGELTSVARIEPRWVDDAWRDTHVVLWFDVTTTLDAAAETFGPQKGATPEAVDRLGSGLARWADVVERDLGGNWKDVPGSGAAGGLGFGLVAGLAAEVVPGAAAVADLVGLRQAIDGADVVVTGEGALDATSAEGKVVGYVSAVGRAAGARVAAVVGRARSVSEDLVAVEEAGPRGPSGDPARDVTVAAERLARRLGGA